ncbi:hypothetical protein D039_3103B, partial [Vibrio parahaemolyticus EKP-028]
MRRTSWPFFMHVICVKRLLHFPLNLFVCTNRHNDVVAKWHRFRNIPSRFF